MAEIKINITELDNAIAKLRGLQSKCDFNDMASPLTVGGGETVNELEDIVDVYKELNIEFENLISNTVLFLLNVRESYVSSDTKAAKNILNK